MVNRLRSLLRALFGRDAFEADVAEEMRLHIELYTADLVRSGVDPVAAARRARIEFGNVHNVRLDSREARGLRPFDEMARNVRYAYRMLRKSRGSRPASWRRSRSASDPRSPSSPSSTPSCFGRCRFRTPAA